MNAKKKNHDPYCWDCCTKTTEHNCSKCLRSFHSRCLEQNQRNNVDSKDWICPVCDELEAADDKPNDVKVLPLIMDRVATNKFYHALKPTQKGGGNSAWKNSDDIVNPINVTMIKHNIEAYKNFAEFRADIQWIQHNCTIAYNESASTKAVRELMEYVEHEIESVKKCAECYEKANKYPHLWFAMACSEPHLLVWAKMKGFNYWPAKLMSIDGQLINVRFFGDHTYADVPATNIYLYSANNPGRRATHSGYNTAIKEVYNYMENIRERFGSFVIAKTKTLFNPALHERYLNDMIPSLAEGRGNHSTNSELSPDSNESMEECSPNNSNEDVDILNESKSEPNESISNAIAQCSVSLERLDTNTCAKLQSVAKRRQSKRSNGNEPNKKKQRFDNEPNDKQEIIDEVIESGIKQKTINTTKSEEKTNKAVITVDITPEDEENASGTANDDPTDANDKNANDVTTSVQSNRSDPVVDDSKDDRSKDSSPLEDAVEKWINDNVQLKKQLKETNQRLDKIIAEDKETFYDLQQKIIQTQSANAKLIETIARLKSANGSKDKSYCHGCGKAQDYVIYCNNECHQKFVENATLNTVKEDEDKTEDKTHV
ncbi:protein kinase C-binding protein 1-like isoform X2 [Contarinia nasturtii]|uniref:protein kinase C-binding protein 1-like isoform X2 n=1 Tax=Contarinia nasturtii TaxID=265458 RepID=UPI0012D456E1|nr:protein kinase C-binding protein 1-like isoform X2 [Contarinia nasturtii]